MKRHICKIKNTAWKRIFFTGQVMKRCIACALAVSLTILLLGACGKRSTDEKTAESDWLGYPILRVSLLVEREAPEDLQMVEDALNRVITQQLRVRIELVPIRYADFSSIYMQLAAQGNPLDMMLLRDGAENLSTYIDNAMIQPLDDYMDIDGRDLSNLMRTKLKAAAYQGRQYAIPQMTNAIGVSAKGFHLSRRLCDRYGIDPAQIQTLPDLEKTFARVKEAEPQLTILMPQSNTSTIAEVLFPYYDGLTIGPGVLTSIGQELEGMSESEINEVLIPENNNSAANENADPESTETEAPESTDNRNGDGKGKGASYRVVSELELPEVKAALERVHLWYQMGYIPRDVNTTDQYGSTMLSQDKCFAVAATDIGPEMGSEDYYSVILTDELPKITTNIDDMFLWVVSSRCRIPDKAVAFLNYAFRNSYVSNLLRYGISGTHYTVNSNGTLEIIADSGYSVPVNQFGNIRDICFTGETFRMAQAAANVQIPTTLRIMHNEWEKEYSPAYGFFFDSGEVMLEIMACREIDNQYYAPIMNGTVDPKTEVPRYLEALYNAGMQSILDAKQLQLDEWMK